MGNIVDAFEDRIQCAILTAIDFIITPMNELAFRLINASSGRNAASVRVISERGEHMEITASFEEVSEKNSTFHENSVNDETRSIVLDELGDFSVSGTHLDWQSHTHHSVLEKTVWPFFSSTHQKSRPEVALTDFIVKWSVGNSKLSVAAKITSYTVVSIVTTALFKSLRILI